LILWFAGGFSVFAIALILFIDKKKASGFHPCKNSLGEDESFDACIKPYQIKRLIATGGMAHVYLGVNARDEADLQIEVVIKKILPSRIDDAHNFTRLFLREAQTAAKLGGHPNIVQIYDYFSRHHVIVMQYIRGQDLQTIFKNQNQGLPIDLTLFIISEIVKGLDYAHTKTDRLTGLPLNIIHRDIKPGNILISYNGQVKIADFGIAKAVGVQDATILMPTGEDTTLLPLALKGTPAYMSPEQAAQETVDHRSDIFSLGLIFYEMLTGSKVRESMHGFSSAKIIKVIDKERIEPVSEFVSDVSPTLNAIVMKCLEKDKKLRYQSTRELHNDMKRLKRKMNITYGSSELASFMRRL
jgi:serine/threonine protein kinase